MSGIIGHPIKKKLAERLGNQPYLDTNIYIYGFEGLAQQRAKLLPLFDFLGDPTVEVVVSELILAELLPKPMGTDDQDLIDRYLDFFERPDGPALVPVNQAIWQLAAELRGDEGLSLGDAVHLATALDHGCTSFLTNDRSLSVVADIDVVIFDDL